MSLDLIERVIPKKPWMNDYQFVLVQSIDHLDKIISAAIESKKCAFDLESTGLDVRVFKGKCKSEVVGYSLAFEPKIGYYVPIRHGLETDKGSNLDPKPVNILIQKLINECECLIGHNWLKFDAEMLYGSEGITLKNVPNTQPYPYHDTFVLARLAGKKPAGLKYLSKTLLNKEMIEIEEVAANVKQGINFAGISPFEGLLYAASDAICTLELFDHPEIQSPIKTQANIYNIERKLLSVVRKMERNKVKLNREHCQSLEKELNDSMMEIQNSIFSEVEKKTNGQIKEFKLDSPDEVSRILFEIYDMNPKPERGKKGNYSTDDEILEKLAPNYPLAKKLQDYRTTTKFQRTYIKNMMCNVDEEGYLKFNFQPLKTDSGRFASPGKDEDSKTNDGYAGVNIQATPARYDKTKPNVRKCISCEPDEVIAALDWSGVELRIACNMSREPIWLERFLKGDGDLHTSTAAIALDKPEDAITKEDRQLGKTINFQSVYGGGAGALSQALNTTFEDAKDKQERFFGRLKTLRAYIKTRQKEASKVGYCTTAFGRIRKLPEYNSDIPKLRASADRKAINTPIQGSAADLMKIAMIQIDKYIEEKGLSDKIQMLLTMHDELVFRVKKTHVDRIKDIENVMRLENILKKIQWEVPLAVDVEIGDSWDVDYEFSKMEAFLKEVYNVENVSYIYEPGRDLKKILKELKEWSDNKKKQKPEPNQKKEAVNSLKAAGEALKAGPILSELGPKKEAEVPSLEIKQDPLPVRREVSVLLDKAVPLEEEKEMSLSTTATAQLDEAFKVLKNVSLTDLPLEAYAKLKKSFYETEIQRILAGEPSSNDEEIELYVVVHKPIDDAKKNMLGFIIDSCKGTGKVKFVNQDKEEMHEGWLSADVLKVSVMSKIFNI